MRRLIVLVRLSVVSRSQPEASNAVRSSDSLSVRSRAAIHGGNRQVVEVSGLLQLAGHVKRVQDEQRQAEPFRPCAKRKPDAPVPHRLDEA
jgi:hypothetical protein